MRVIIKNLNLEFECVKDVGSLDKDTSKVFKVDRIYSDVMNSYDELPIELRRKHLMLYSFDGNITSRYRYKSVPAINVVDYLKFEDRSYFKSNSNEIIDEEGSEDDPIYVKSNNIIRDLEYLIEDYIKYNLKFENITLTQDTPWGVVDIKTEYLLNSWGNHEYPNYDSIQKDYDLNKDLIEEYSSKYIPDSGKASTKFGELLRACQRVVYRYFNDGDMCSNVTDGNIFSYVNIPTMIEWMSESEYKAFVDNFNKVRTFGVYNDCEEPSEFVSLLLEGFDEDYNIRVVVAIESALALTKKDNPEFMNESNPEFDSRYWNN